MIQKIIHSPTPSETGQTLLDAPLITNPLGTSKIKKTIRIFITIKKVFSSSLMVADPIITKITFSLFMSHQHHQLYR